MARRLRHRACECTGGECGKPTSCHTCKSLGSASGPPPAPAPIHSAEWIARWLGWPDTPSPSKLITWGGNNASYALHIGHVMVRLITSPCSAQNSLVQRTLASSACVREIYG
eukprot:9473098-Pyramimonas_sp.AAC.2